MAGSLSSAVRSALAKINAGRGFDLTLHERLSLAQADRDLGASRPLASYAPRTQRRYVRGLDQGATATEIRHAERSKLATPRREIHRLGQELLALGIDTPHSDHHPEQLDDMITVYGEAEILKRLRSELADTKEYIRTKDSPRGRISIINYRNGISGLRPRATGVEVGTPADGLYYYHGALK